MSRIKILFVLASVSGGGAERVVLNIIKHLNRKLFEPRLALLQYQGDYLDMIPEDVPGFDLNMRRARYAIIPLNRVIIQNKPDLVISTSAYINATYIYYIKNLRTSFSPCYAIP